MVLIGLVSDTHITPMPRPSPKDPRFPRFPTSIAGSSLPPEILAALRGVDIILHAGDVYSPIVLDELETVAPVICARGNGDAGLDGDRRVKSAQLLEVEGVAIGVIHSTIPLGSPQAEFDKFQSNFFGRALDVLVCGDSHVPLVEEMWGLLLVNPGSPTMPNGHMGLLGSVGVLRINASTVIAEVVDLAHIQAREPLANDKR